MAGFSPAIAKGQDLKFGIAKAARPQLVLIGLQKPTIIGVSYKGELLFKRLFTPSENTQQLWIPLEDKGFLGYYSAIGKDLRFVDSAGHQIQAVLANLAQPKVNDGNEPVLSVQVRLSETVFASTNSAPVSLRRTGSNTLRFDWMTKSVVQTDVQAVIQLFQDYDPDAPSNMDDYIEVDSETMSSAVRKIQYNVDTKKSGYLDITFKPDASGETFLIFFRKKNPGTDKYEQWKKGTYVFKIH